MPAGSARCAVGPDLHAGLAPRRACRLISFYPWTGWNASIASTACSGSRRLVSTRHFDDLEISRATFKRDLDVLRERLHAPTSTTTTRRPIATTTRSPTARSGNCRDSGSQATQPRALLTMDQLLADLQPGCCRS